MKPSVTELVVERKSIQMAIIVSFKLDCTNSPGTESRCVVNKLTVNQANELELHPIPFIHLIYKIFASL